MKILRKSMLLVLCTAVMVSTTQARPYFNASKDLLICQYDSRPDPDDIHAQAAAGSMFIHSDWSGVNKYAVQGAYGDQTSKFYDSASLFAMIFGTKNTGWTDAHNDYWGSVSRIRAKAKPILQNGGKVWVAEAGQSNITADWIWALINTDGIAASTVKANVIVVQHEDAFNERWTTPSDLSYVKDKSTYFLIDDGNSYYGNTDSWANHGPYDTPSFKNSSSTYIEQAKSSSNPNATARQYWIEADRIAQTATDQPWSTIIKDNGVDFSDTVEIWWILNDTISGNNVGGFWDKYVTNTPSTPPATQGPYGGSARSITSTIEAEHYDTGGQNVAYYDTSSGNTGGQVRSDDVDVGNSDGRKTVGWTAGGEWLEYTVNASSGTYDIEMVVASPYAGKRIVVKLDGTTLGTLTVPNTGGWHTYQTAKISGVSVSGGNGKILRLELPDGGLNLDSVKFVTAGGGGGQSPYGGTKRKFPGRVEAEHYDLGGEGVAYHDTTAGNSGGALRSDRVDVAARDGGHMVGWTAGGEWLEYTIDVTGGQYTLKARVASPYSGKRIVVKVDGNIIRTITVPNTGSWSAYQETSITGVWIGSKNDRILRLEFPDGGLNCNWVELK